jgi:hypothetical protein
MREDMWQSVKSRNHAPQKVYANDSEGDDLMLFGTVRCPLLSTIHKDCCGSNTSCPGLVFVAQRDQDRSRRMGRSHGV